MRELSVAGLVVAAAIVGTSIVQGQTKTDPILNKLAADFATAYNAKDAAKVASMYAEDAVVMPPNEPMLTGRTAIEARLKKEMQESPVTIGLTPTESSTSGDRAHEAGIVSITLPDGSKLTEKYLVVFKKVGSDWKIAYDIWNSDTPPTPKK